MKLFGSAKAIRGSIAWTNPFRIRIVLPQDSHAPALPKTEYDEEGRLYVFRYAKSAPISHRIERDRIFDYLRHHRLPNEADRQIRRDLRNSADLYGDLRDLQTHPEVEGA